MKTGADRFLETCSCRVFKGFREAVRSEGKSQRETPDICRMRGCVGCDACTRRHAKRPLPGIGEDELAEAAALAALIRAGSAMNTAAGIFRD